MVYVPYPWWSWWTCDTVCLLRLGPKRLQLLPGSPGMLALGMACLGYFLLGLNVTLWEAQITWRKHIEVLQMTVPVLTDSNPGVKQVNDESSYLSFFSWYPRFCGQRQAFLSASCSYSWSTEPWGSYNLCYFIPLRLGWLLWSDSQTEKNTNTIIIKIIPYVKLVDLENFPHSLFNLYYKLRDRYF